MKKLSLIFLLIFFVCSPIVLAQRVNSGLAVQVSTRFMENIKRQDPSVAYIKQNTIGNHLCLYEVVFNDSSWCIVPADMGVDPILAYGFERASSDDLPEAFQKLIEWYKVQLDTIIYYDSINGVTHPLWTQLLDTKNYFDYTIGDSLLDMTGRGKLCWKQGTNNDNGCSPSYNQDCPSTLINCYKCYHEPVGCAAVALGEIMWYWRWPESSIYDWDGMPSKLRNTTEQDSASNLSKFLFNCGGLVNMTYACTGSFSTSDNIVEALNNRLNYKGAHKLYKSDWIYGSSWNDIIKSEIDNKRPVIFYGDSWSFFTGHFFVVDGYQENNGSILYHVNWGHGGTNNSFCKLDRLKEIIHNGNSLDTNYYDINNRAIVGISPTYSINPNISEVYYTTIPNGYNRNEYATHNISIPSSGNTLTIEAGGDLIIEAGQNVALKDGFWAKQGSNVSVSINQKWVNGMAISVPFWPTFTDETGYGIQQENADSWEFSLMNRNYEIVFQSAGSIRSDNVTLWDGHGVASGSYLGIITLKNSYGRSLHQELAITVTNRGLSNHSDSIDSTAYDELTLNTHPNLIQLDTTLRAYPNPSSGIFELSLESDTIVSVDVYNTMGQHIYTDDNIILLLYMLNISKCTSGEYIVVVRGNKNYYTAKVLKQ